MAEISCLFCHEVFSRQNAKNRHERKRLLGCDFGETFPVFTQMPNDLQSLSDVEKTDRCFENNFFCEGIFPFVFLSERDYPKTIESLSKVCAINNCPLFRDFVSGKGHVELRKCFLPVSGGVICLNKCLQPKISSLQRPSWVVHNHPTTIAISIPNYAPRGQVSETGSTRIMFEIKGKKLFFLGSPPSSAENEGITFLIPDGLSPEQYKQIFLSAPPLFQRYINKNLNPSLFAEKDLRKKTGLTTELFQHRV